MLTELHVSHFAIIDDLHMVFHPGFNVLTGETGAGKSIIIDAIDLLLGGKSSQEMVRAGERTARVEGIFELEGEAADRVRAWLQTHELEDEDGQVILAREVRRGGRSVARINGRAVAQILLAELGDMLVDIHGQGQHLSLLKPRTHILLLDAFAGLKTQREEVARLVAELRGVRAELARLRQNAREIARRVDLLSYQVEEIDAAGLTPGEEALLQSELRRLANAETLMSETAALNALLAEGDGESPSALDLLGQAMTHLQKLARLDPDLVALPGQAEALFDGLSDLAREVADYAAGLEFDPGRLADVEERLALIHQLKRKYGDDIEEILAFAEEARAELALLADSETRTEALEARETDLLRAIGEQAAALSQARQAAAEALARAVERELADLRMADTRFRVAIEQRADPEGCFVDDARLAFDATGIDRVAFLVSANPGEPLRPLAKVASGGETARLMLALKHVLSQADATPTLIFDEIDQGIGGRVGAVVGRKMRDLARTHQVLCVTHLPQIAAYADRHLQVTKGRAEERTVSQLHVLEGEARVQELAAMLGADTDAGRRSAQELLDQAREEA
ncbi:MAG TPA: DNA repair protein RecN [Anaerolineae bacterium]|nr:DNA repair protein RecN [Anaerolineae bacterium]